MAVAIDTLRYAESFTEAGLEPRVAKVLAHAFAEAHAIAREDLVTKEYLDFRLAEFERRMDVRFAAVDARFSSVDVKIAEAKVEMIRWIVGSQVAMLTAIVALANFTKLLG
jgi:hypothetical protein